MLAFHIDHLQKVVQGRERSMIGDVIDEEEGVRAQVGGRPETAVFFLAGRVGEGEEIGFPIDVASDRV